MRILYLVHQYFPHAVGGTEIYARGLQLSASFAVANQGVMASICRPPHKLLEALAPHALSRRWVWRAGERALHEVDGPDEQIDLSSARHPELADRLEAELDAWLRREAPASGPGWATRAAARSGSAGA